MLGETRRGNLLNNRTMRTRYKIVLFINDTYEVLMYEDDSEEVGEFDYNKAYGVHQGTLEDCAAWIHARENGWS